MKGRKIESIFIICVMIGGILIAGMPLEIRSTTAPPPETPPPETPPSEPAPPEPSNYPPVADFSWWPHSPTAGQPVRFSSRASYDFDGYIVEWWWDFGDGHGSDEKNPTYTYHSYNYDTSYFVTLEVTDNDGKKGDKEREVPMQRVTDLEVHDVEITNMPGKTVQISFYVTNHGGDCHYSYPYQIYLEKFHDYTADPIGSGETDHFSGWMDFDRYGRHVLGVYINMEESDVGENNWGNNRYETEIFLSSDEEGE